MINKPVKRPVVAPLNAVNGNVSPPSQNVQLPHRAVNPNTDGKSLYNNPVVSQPPLGSKP